MGRKKETSRKASRGKAPNNRISTKVALMSVQKERRKPRIDPKKEEWGC
jgi:hypothetical protein